MTLPKSLQEFSIAEVLEEIRRDTDKDRDRQEFGPIHARDGRDTP